MHELSGTPVLQQLLLKNRNLKSFLLKSDVLLASKAEPPNFFSPSVYNSTRLEVLPEINVC